MKFKSFSNPITEGAVKSSMEDWLYDLPKAVISEIKKKYGKILAAANKPPYKTVFSADVKDGIGKILMANKVKPLMGSHKESVGAITMSFDTYHGDVNEGKKSWLDTILAAQAKAKSEDILDGKPRFVKLKPEDKGKKSWSKLSPSPKKESVELGEPIMDLIEKRKSYELRQASLMLRQGASGKEVKDTIGRKRTPEGKSGNALLRKALLDAEVPTIIHGRSSDYTDEPLPPRIQKHNASRGVPTTLARKAAQANKPVKEEIELDEAGQAKLYRMRQSHGRAWRRGDTKKQTAMGNATYDKQTKEDERDVKRTGSIFNMRAKRMAGNRKLLGLSDSFEVQHQDEVEQIDEVTKKRMLNLTGLPTDKGTIPFDDTPQRPGGAGAKRTKRHPGTGLPRSGLLPGQRWSGLLGTQMNDPKKVRPEDRFVLRGEEVELDEASNTIPDSAIVLTQNLQKKTITFTWYDGNTEKWIEREVPQDEAPGFYTRAGTAMKARKTDKYGNLLKVPVTDIDAAKRAKEMEAVSARNIVTAKDLLNTIEKKKVGTKFELYGTKNGKEHTLKVRKSMLMAQVVYFTTGDREVLFQATASGLTVMDKKTRRPLLSGGNDMIWESTDLTDVGHMMIEISEATEKPKILERLIGQLKSKGMEVGQATAIATSTLQKSGSLKSGSHTLTKKGAKRQGMGAAGRAKHRAATESGKPTNSYAYNPQTNKATLRT